MFRKLIAAFCLIAVLACPADALTGTRRILLAGSTPNNLSIDGTAQNSATAGTSLTVTISTTKPNDFLVLEVNLNGISAETIASVTDTAGLSWTLRKRVSNVSTNTNEEWTAPAPGILTSDIVTVNFAVAATFVRAAIASFNGVNTISAFDPNASLPAGCTTSSCTVTPATTNRNTVSIAQYRMGSTANPTAGAGWTQISTGAGSFFLVEYQIVSMPQTSAATLGGGATDQTAGVGDALTQ